LSSTSQGEYRSILKSVGFQEAPTGELLEREQRALGRKREAEIIYDRLHEAVRASKGLERLDSALGSTEDVDYSAMVNDSTDAEGEPDTTTSAPAIATEKANGEKTQMMEPQGESKEKTSPVPEVSAITFGDHCSPDTHLLIKDHDELQVSSRPCSPGMTIMPASGGRTRRWRQETTCSL
jgi:hypothetical protein